MADKYILTSSVFSLGLFLFVSFGTLGFSSCLFYNTYLSINYAFGEENYGIKLEYQRILVADFDELRNYDEQTQFWTVFVASNNPKGNGLLCYYCSKTYVSIMCMIEDGNRFITQRKAGKFVIAC